MAFVTIAQGQTSNPIFVPAGSIVTVVADSGATGAVEYTTDSVTWAAWPNGSVTALSSDLTNEDLYMRVTASGGIVRFSSNETPTKQDLRPYYTDFHGAGVRSEGRLLPWAYNQTFQLVSAARDANGAITTASIVWPDGTAGVFTTDTASTAFPGAIDAWHATYLGTTTKTVTQPAVTRDANGAVTVQPAITIS